MCNFLKNIVIPKMKLTYLLLLSILIGFSACEDSDDIGRCGLAPNVGNCDALIIKYYYDKDEQKCKEFSWGGCGGVVPFDTLEECKECEASS